VPEANPSKRFLMENVSEFAGDPTPAPSRPNETPTSDRRSVRAVAAAFRHAARHDDASPPDTADAFGP